MMICWICKSEVIDDILLYFQRYYGDILLEIHQVIVVHVNDLNMWSVRDIEIPTGEINAIEGIQIVPGFKCIAGSECQKLCNTSRSIEIYCRSIYDWNIMKDNMTILIYWYISKIMNFTININNFPSSQYQIFPGQNNIDKVCNLRPTGWFNFGHVDDGKATWWGLSSWAILNQ